MIGYRHAAYARLMGAAQRAPLACTRVESDGTPSVVQSFYYEPDREEVVCRYFDQGIDCFPLIALVPVLALDPLRTAFSTDEALLVEMALIRKWQPRPFSAAV